MSRKQVVGIFIVLLIVVGVAVAGIAVQQSTETQQHASIFNDLNTAGSITQTNNPDGTMGPATWEGNFSNTLPAAYLGTLNFGVTDPAQGRPSGVGDPALPTQAQGRGNQPTLSSTPTSPAGTTITPTAPAGQNGPQTVTALVLTVTKAEVHVARLGIPGARNTIEPTRTEATTGRSATPAQKDNQSLDKWETLNIGQTKTVDLVQLAKTKDVASLGLTKLANGLYTEVRLYIGSATATLTNGTKVTLSIPGKANIVRVVEPFVINSGKTTTVSMDFDAQNSVIRVGDTYILKPVVAHFTQTNQE